MSPFHLLHSSHLLSALWSRLPERSQDAQLLASDAQGSVEAGCTDTDSGNLLSASGALILCDGRTVKLLQPRAPACHLLPEIFWGPWQ